MKIIEDIANIVFLEELHNYFINTPREKVLEDWEKSKEFDKVGPTMEEFLENVSSKDLDPEQFKK